MREALLVRFWHTFGMARFGGLGFRCWFVAKGMRLLLCALVLAVGWSIVASAAQEPTAVVDGGVPTLHVYTNLIQIPTLVLGPNRERIKTPIAESRFSVSIDNGPWFRATHVRLEGDDPISLSILLDVSETAELMPKIGDVIASLAPLSLRPKDHVSIYALDCSLVQSLNDVPAERERLKTGVDEALQSWTIREQSKQDCQQSVHLWDALAQITDEMSKLPGRRVILAVTNGRDRGSRSTWNEARSLAENRGVAVFGLSYLPPYARDTTQAFLRWSSEDPFHSLCELSGGTVLSTNTRSVEQALKRFTAMLRERYIVEFPRPAKATPGVHVKEIKIARSNDFIRPAGISVPIPDAALLADPTTVPSDPTRTPELGTRAPMKKPQ
jgi:hypothetical protein